MRVALLSITLARAVWADDRWQSPYAYDYQSTDGSDSHPLAGTSQPLLIHPVLAAASLPLLVAGAVVS